MFLHEIWWLYLLQWINLIRKQTLSRDIWLTRDSLTKLNHGAGKHQISNTNILNKVAIFCKLFVCSGISSMLNLGYLKIHIILLFFLCGGVEVNRQPTRYLLAFECWATHTSTSWGWRRSNISLLICIIINTTDKLF